jgi:tetratricopeptide (TPR) repeat protein
VSPRARVALAVATVAVAAAAVTVGAAALQSRGDDADRQAAPQGAPPVALELGLRDDAEARLLRRAADLHNDGNREAAGRLFARSASLEAQVGRAFARWPAGTVGRLRALIDAQPRSGLLWVNLGLAELWSGRREAALGAWRTALEVDPDTPYAVRADHLLRPETPDGLPEFVPSFGAPAAVRRLPAARQLAALARVASGGGAREKLLYGVGLQRVGRPVSAERQFAAAARLAPGDPEALTAAAVGLFRKSRPTPAFARLGPLSRRFPRAPVVRLHLGILLLWMGRADAAVPRLRRAVELAPRSVHGRRAARLLTVLEGD